jgi:hypothetical protein
MLVQLHIHPDTAECDPFHAQAESLLSRLFPRKFDGSAGTDHPLPRQSTDLPQDADDLAGRSGPPGGSRDGSVSRHSSLR